jgi:hypothetical protein
MTKKLKLFVWEGVLEDYTSGVMFALAPDVKTARELLLASCDYLPKEDLNQEPTIYTEPYALAVWGGG